MIRWLTAGESHGPALSAILEGMPAQISITKEMIDKDLQRRRLGFGRGARQTFEADVVSILGGVRHGQSQGGPIALQIANSEWPKWSKVMAPEVIDEKDLSELARNAPLTRPRPGHADLVGMQKYAFDDARPILERASARETAARVAAGALAKQLLSHLGVGVLSHVVRMGDAAAPSVTLPTMADLAAIDASEVRCFSKSGEDAMIAAIKAAAREGDSLGGIVEVIAHGVPIGLGSHVHWDRKIDALLAQAIMSIQAVKGVEIGDGWEVAGLRGSQAHDPISWDATEHRYVRDSHRSGGTEGGITTGEPLIVRAAMKPLATLNKPTLKTVDTLTKEETVSFKERTDVTAVPAMGVIAETMVALVLAAEAQRKFGGDSLSEFVRNATSFRATLES